jgi:hypothetical protein
LSVAARAAEISARLELASPPGAVSTGNSSGASPIASGQPWRSASTACAARREGELPLRDRTP